MAVPASAAMAAIIRKNSGLPMRPIIQLDEGREALRGRSGRRHIGELHISVGNVHEDGAAGIQVAPIDLHRFARHQMDGDRVRREGIENNEIVGLR